MKRIYQVCWMVMPVVLLCAISACDSGHSSNSGSGSIQLNIQMPVADGSLGTQQPSAINCDASRIVHITAAVLSAAGTDIEAQGGPWSCHLGKGSIDEVPSGNDLIVEVRAMDAADRVTYYGRTLNVSIRKGYVTPVSVTLEAVAPTPVVSLVKDLFSGAKGSYPHQLNTFGGRLFFVARQPEIDFELFITDGSDAGTRLIRDIYPHPMVVPSAEPVPEPSDMTACNGLFYFIADDGSYGPGLWQTDGTTENTHMIDGFEEMGIVNPSHLTVLDDRLFFSAEHSTYGRELWQSDGTAAGTHIVHDIFTGLASSNPHELTAMRNWLYFVADDGNHGYEIWRTNGTSTALVQDIDRTVVPGTPSRTKDSFPSDLTVVNGRLFCRAVDTPIGDEIWMISADDTFARADLVTDLNAYQDRSSRPRFLTAIDDTYLAFSAKQINAGESATLTGTELWLFDLVSGADPYRVTDINPGSGCSNPGNFVSMGGVLYFTANNSRDEEHLWSWPLGSAAAPVCLTAALIDPAPRYLTVFEGRLYFSAFEDRFGRELWYTDGTATAKVNDLCPDACSSSPSDFAVLDNQLLFSAYEPGSGQEIYRLEHEYQSGP